MTTFSFATLGATALALLLSGPALAQGQGTTQDEATDGDAQVGGQPVESAIEEADAPDTAETDPVNETPDNEVGGSVPTGDGQGDTLFATVGDAEIRGSDVMTVIGMLPPELQSQPPQMLVPMALEQLILRELILEQARAESLATDPDVVALVENSAQGAEEDAMVQVWVQRQMDSAVTDEAVQRTYDEARTQGQDLPDIAQVRPQIENFLRQQAMQDIRTRLQEGADVVFYDATGRPVEQTQGAASGSEDAASDSTDSATGSDSGDGNADDPSGSQSETGSGSSDNN